MGGRKIPPIELSKIQGILPEGWTAEAIEGYKNVFTLYRPKETDGGGAVTIDCSRRIFALGICFPERMAKLGAEYNYKGWLENLVNDAVKFLNDIMEK